MLLYTFECRMACDYVVWVEELSMVVTPNDCTYKQDRQCTYNVTQRGVRATIVAVENLQLLHVINVCL